VNYYFLQGSFREKEKQGLNRATKLDRDERTHQKTLEGTRSRRRPRGHQRRPPGPPQAGQPGLEANRLLLCVTQSNRPLRRILTLDSSRFDSRAAVHPTRLYN
jgi:hypothetical protein